MASIQLLQIASLDCDIPVPNVYAERGFYSDIFETLLKKAARTEFKDVDVDLSITRYDCMRGELPSEEELGDIDGIIITGSASSAYDDVPWIHSLTSFIKQIYHHNPHIKLFGSCFGHQLLSHALFSTPSAPVVSKDPSGWEIGVHPITLTPSFLTHFGPAVTSNPTSPTQLRLQFIHADHVVLSLSMMEKEGFESIGRSEHCALQGVWKRGRVLTYQGHAEFDTFVNAETVKVFGKGVWSEEFIEKVMEGVERGDDSVWAAGVMLRFFLEGEEEDGAKGKELGDEEEVNERL